MIDKYFNFIGIKSSGIKRILMIPIIFNISFHIFIIFLSKIPNIYMYFRPSRFKVWVWVVTIFILWNIFFTISIKTITWISDGFDLDKRAEEDIE